jgi:hypothetical protein
MADHKMSTEKGTGDEGRKMSRTQPRRRWSPPLISLVMDMLSSKPHPHPTLPRAWLPSTALQQLGTGPGSPPTLSFKYCRAGGGVGGEVTGAVFMRARVSPMARLGSCCSCLEVRRKQVCTAPRPCTPPGSPSCLPVTNSQSAFPREVALLCQGSDRQTDRHKGREKL